MGDQQLITVDLQLPFADNNLAKLVYDVLRIDQEDKRTGVSKDLCVDNNVLKAKFLGKPKHIRIVTSSFISNVELVMETYSAFGQNA